METLSELIQVVNRKRLSKIDLLDKTFLNRKSENLYYQLYNAIEKKKVTTDDEAAKLIYGTGKDDPRFRMLKSRLKDKVMKSVLLLETNETFTSESGKAYYECITHCQIIETLIYLDGTNKLIHELVKDNYSTSLKYHFYDILKSYSYFLLSYYSLKGDKKLFLFEEANFFKYSELSQKEQLAKYLYFKVIVDIVNNTTITNNFILFIDENLQKLYKIKEEIKKPEIDFYYFYLGLIFCDYKNDVKRMWQICSAAEGLMSNKPHITTNTRRTIILYYKMKALLYSKEYTIGIELLKSFDNKFILEPSYNWFVVKEFEFKLYLQDHKIKEAYDVYMEVIKSKQFKRHVEQLTEKWKIYHAYLVFMDNYLNDGDYKFSLSKFLNDVPVNSKDKSGFNFAIRIVEMLFLFGQKKYNFVFQKTDALRVYRTRYLNDNTYKRNHLFLSLLLKAEKTGFNGREMQKAGWTEINELRNNHNHIIADWEIMPYEVLWDIIAELAKK